jgi:hypothetical protein
MFKFNPLSTPPEELNFNFTTLGLGNSSYGNSFSEPYKLATIVSDKKIWVTVMRDDPETIFASDLKHVRLLGLETEEFPTRVIVTICETSLFIFTNMGNFYKADYQRHHTEQWTLSVERIVLPIKGRKIVDFVATSFSKDFNAAILDDTGTIWMCSSIVGDHSVRDIVFGELDISHKITKICGIDDSALFLQENDQILQLTLEGPPVKVRRITNDGVAEQEHLHPHVYLENVTIPEYITIVSISVTRTCTYLLDQYGEIWVNGRTFPEFSDDVKDDPYSIRSKKGEIEQWPKSGAPMRCFETGNLDAKEIHAFSSLCLILKSDGEWWYLDCSEVVDSEKLHKPCYIPRICAGAKGCKLLTMGPDWAWFILPDIVDSHNLLAWGPGIFNFQGMFDGDNWECRPIPDFVYVPYKPIHLYKNPRSRNSVHLLSGQ